MSENNYYKKLTDYKLFGFKVFTKETTYIDKLWEENDNPRYNITVKQDYFNQEFNVNDNKNQN